MTHILLLTDNYPPEMNASANRCSAHAERWTEMGVEVSVVTSFPNFPDGAVFPGYRQSLYSRENINGVSLLRVPTLIFPNTGTIKRILDFVSFMLSGMIGALFIRRPDVVVATSPQFFTAVGGWLVCFLRRRPFVLELRDLWPDSIVAVGALKEGRLVSFIRQIERFIYRRADLIVTVTEGSRDTLVARGVDADKIVVVRNGAQTALLTPGRAEGLREELGISDRIVVSYIGTLGMAHGLNLVLDAAQMLEERLPNVVFMLVGAGAERDELKRLSAGRKNLLFVDRVPHAEIASYWHASDIALALLRDAPLFRTVTPSKVFEAMATGTPLICNVPGETEALIKPLGVARFIESGSVEALVEAIAELARDPGKRSAMASAGPIAARQFDRALQAEAMLLAIDTLLLRGRSGRPTS